ncbi:MAG TPA: beta-N-acetylhexosaminidase [Xanthobacteraceae bacterium]|nr:beta-N-acetylhexosaminidase [Xanthobacteraceae bacterium]
MTARAFITGVSGTELTGDERSFLRDADPWGLILFKRNIDTPSQVRALVDGFRNAVGRGDAPVLVDQEGGRVQRLGPPHWPNYPAGAQYGRIWERDQASAIEAARLGARLIAADLISLGIDVDCLPVADVPAPGADPVIGDRAYGDRPEKVAAIAEAVAEGLMAGGVLPVLKHLPGHGRATTDSHHSLPTVAADPASLDAVDFAAFRPLAALPMGMTAHVVFSAFDPIAPATTSATMIQEVIRDSIGFAGLLMSDDISMGALSGSLMERSRAALAAGCDVILHCNGALDEMRAVADATPHLAGAAQRRAAAALAARHAPDRDSDLGDLRRAFAALISGGRAAGAAMALS